MGTSSRYVWGPGRSITEPVTTAEPDSPELSTAIRRTADEFCESLRDPRWRRDLTQPVVTAAAGATARACHAFGDFIEGDRDWPSTDVQLSGFVAEVCGDNDGVHDAPIRRALVRAMDQLDVKVQDRHARGLPLTDDLFCLFYQLFHTELLTELILHLICETTLPGVSTLVLQSELGHWAAERVAQLLPNPCKDPNPRGTTAPVRGAQLAIRALGALFEGPEVEVPE